MRFYAGITLYHPNDTSIEYIKLVGKIFNKVIIYDNSEKVKENIPTQTDLNGFNIEYYAYNENNGLSVAYNFFLHKCIDENADYLFLLDQDSCFDINIVKQFIKDVSEKNINNNVAIYALRTIFYNNLFNQNEKNIFSDTNFVISSGSCINISKIIESDIFYDENIFIDHLDFDFCKKIKTVGYEIVILNKYCVNQKLGYMHKNKICHAPIRFYYFTRDRLYINKRDYSFPIYIYYNIRSLLRIIFKMILLNEDRKIDKLKYVFLGCIDFFRNVKGNINKR